MLSSGGGALASGLGCLRGGCRAMGVRSLSPHEGTQFLKGHLAVEPGRAHAAGNVYAVMNGELSSMPQRFRHCPCPVSSCQCGSWTMNSAVQSKSHTRMQTVCGGSSHAISRRSDTGDERQVGHGRRKQGSGRKRKAPELWCPGGCLPGFLHPAAHFCSCPRLAAKVVE